MHCGVTDAAMEQDRPWSGAHPATQVRAQLLSDPLAAREECVAWPCLHSAESVLITDMHGETGAFCACRKPTPGCEMVSRCYTAELEAVEGSLPP